MTTQHDIADTITDLANLSPPEAGQAFTRLVAEKRLSLVMAEINRLLLTPGSQGAEAAGRALQKLGFPLSA